MLAQLNLRPDRKQLREFGWVALVAFGILGGVVLWKGGLFGVSFGARTPAVAYGLWSLGVVSALLSLLWPSGNRPLFVVLSTVAFPIGWILSHTVLAIFFYFVLTPVGLLFRLIGRDPLERAFDSERKSYWVDLPEVKHKRDYFRQF
jgi:hypothetical protein